MYLIPETKIVPGMAKGNCDRSCQLQKVKAGQVLIWFSDFILDVWFRRLACNICPLQSMYRKRVEKQDWMLDVDVDVDVVGQRRW